MVLLCFDRLYDKGDVALLDQCWPALKKHSQRKCLRSWNTSGKN